MSLQNLVLVVAMMHISLQTMTVAADAILPPQFTDQPRWPDRNYYDEDGPPITLECRVTKGAEVTLLWYKNGDTLHSIPGILVISDHNETATLVSPTPNQTGNYTCLAYNMAGNVSHSGYILIAARKQETRPRVTMTIPASPVKHAVIGNSVNISCVFDVGGSSTALLDLTMLWMKGEMEVDDTNHTTHGINTTQDNNQVFSLSIDKLQASDYGVYECLGINMKGNDSRLITISPPEPVNKNLPLSFIIGGSVGGFVVIATIVTIAILVRHRISVRQNYEKLEWEEPDVTKYDVPVHTPEYDVFISYSSDDLPWVKDALFQWLGDQRYQVCIDFKDFTPGMAVSENIMDAIYKSRKTIVLMSGNFLKSMWGQFELQQAHNRAVTQRQDVLVLIKYDACKVPAKLMGKTFLDWTDPSVQPHFWTRLYEALGDPSILSQGDVNLDKNTDMQDHISVKDDIERITDTFQVDNEISEGHDDLNVRHNNKDADVHKDKEDVSIITDEFQADSKNVERNNSKNNKIRKNVNKKPKGNIGEVDDDFNESSDQVQKNWNSVIEILTETETDILDEINSSTSVGCKNVDRVTQESPVDVDMDSGIHELELGEDEFNLDTEIMIDIRV